jgi:acyl dehydratase
LLDHRLRRFFRRTLTLRNDDTDSGQFAAADADLQRIHQDAEPAHTAEFYGTTYQGGVTLKF